MSEDKLTFHLIGIGGAGMSVVAELLLAQGYEVSGSDREHTAVTDALSEAGAKVFYGHQGANVPVAAVVVVSSAIKESNPELAVALERGQRILHRSQALALAAIGRDFVAVAGTHGKTSTSSMIAVALGELGRDPSRAIGGSLVGGVPGGYMGSGQAFVAEADESDESFLNYQPRIAVVTNVEADHLDHYGTEAAVVHAFEEFARRVIPGGLLICCSDDPGARALAVKASGEGIRVLTYGRELAPALLEKSDGLGASHVAVVDVPAKEGYFASVVLSYGGEDFSLNLRVPGKHMALNAAAAWAAGVELGEDGQQLARALSAFKGAERRFELLGSAQGVLVVDDYGHHPTEVAATIGTAREVTKGSVHVLFRPLTYARTKIFAREFAAELSGADRVVVTSVYSSRDQLADGAQGDAIAALMEATPFIADEHEAVCALASGIQPGDVAIMLGPKVRHLGFELLELLQPKDQKSAQ